MNSIFFFTTSEKSTNKSSPHPMSESNESRNQGSVDY